MTSQFKSQTDSQEVFRLSGMTNFQKEAQLTEEWYNDFSGTFCVWMDEQNSPEYTRPYDLQINFL